MNNCKNPLKLTWHEEVNQYKVNKPEDQSGLYVDKAIADLLLAALQNLKARYQPIDPVFNLDYLPWVNDAIDKATK